MCNIASFRLFRQLSKGLEHVALSKCVVDNITKCRRIVGRNRVKQNYRARMKSCRYCIKGIFLALLCRGIPVRIRK